MNQSCRNRSCKVGLLGALAVSGAIITSANPALAQIAPDNTLPTSSRVTSLDGSGLVDQIDQGTIRGTNLFHSFREFNVGQGRGAYFTNPSGIENILSRVTGNDPSNILGTLGVLGKANLFLMNPNGIFFGPNASLDVSGSFVATTANAVKLGDTGLFSASKPATSNLLKVNPSALFFNALASQAKITNHSTATSPVLGFSLNGLPSTDGLQVPNGQSLLLIGGDILLKGGNLTAPGGRIELGSITGPGSVRLSPTIKGWALGYEGIKNFGNIQLSQLASVDSSNLFEGGDIQIQGGRVTLTGDSEILSGSFQDLEGGQITIGTLHLDIGGGSLIGNLSLGSGADVTVETGSLTLWDRARVDTSSTSGRAGNVTIGATDSVAVNNDGSLLASGIGGDGGNLSVKTARLSIDGGSIFADTLGSGNAGIINIQATDSIEVLSGFIAASTFMGTSKGGDVTIKTGKNGEITIQDGSSISSESYGRSLSGNVTIVTRQLNVQNRAEVSVKGVVESANAGNIKVIANSILLEDKGKIIASTPSGSGGNITLQVQNLLRMRRNSLVSTEAGTTEAGEPLISTEAGTTEAVGDGGNITIDTNFIIAIPQEDNDITANSFTGRGGRVQVTAQGIFGTQFRESRTSQSDITASSEFGLDGIVQINTPDAELQGSLTQLSANFISPEQVVAGSCLARRNVERGSLTVTGTGGLPRSPYEAISGRYDVTGVQPIQGGDPASTGAEELKTTPWKKGDPIQEAQGMVVTADGRTIVGTTPQLVTLAKAQNLVCHSD